MCDVVGGFLGACNKYDQDIMIELSETIGIVILYKCRVRAKEGLCYLKGVEWARSLCICHTTLLCLAILILLMVGLVHMKKGGGCMCPLLVADIAGQGGMEI